MSTNQHFRMQLNNRCQYLGKSHKFEDSTTGPQHQPTWTSIAYVNGIEYGQGSGPSRDVAKERAAQQALNALG
ncbi:hypothetical protein BDQ12DRAFT_727057 [Crucibulum laeve]|uniref:DRBM domain-containing protein n=1 Tax=Crucibulum laeve TaxID=68775 RepID=A0A5C3LNV5_9AGAR|nr:hypothetical protein BDQ12DRAFT_727057 [Crucibulum laeve]